VKKKEGGSSLEKKELKHCIMTYCVWQRRERKFGLNVRKERNRPSGKKKGKLGRSFS